MNALINASGEQTMSSREIAELCEKRHDNVRRTIETLAEQGVIVRPQIEDEPGSDAMGRPRTTKVYVFSGEKGKRDSIVVVAQLSPEFTARLVDRWQELEARARPVPMQLSRMDLIQLALEAERELQAEREQRQLLEEQVAADAPKVQALELIAASPDSLTLTQASKVLGVPLKRLTQWLSANAWCYRQNGSWVAYRSHIQNGDLEYKEHSYFDSGKGLSCCKPYCHVTPKGLTKLAKVFSAQIAEPA